MTTQAKSGVGRTCSPRTTTNPIVCRKERLILLTITETHPLLFFSRAQCRKYFVKSTSKFAQNMAPLPQYITLPYLDLAYTALNNSNITFDSPDWDWQGDVFNGAWVSYTCEAILIIVIFMYVYRHLYLLPNYFHWLRYTAYVISTTKTLKVSMRPNFRFNNISMKRQ